MSHRYSLISLGAMTLLLVASLSAFAQTGEMRGHVIMKNADGTSTPVAGAVIDVFRTDIAGKYNTKTDKKGQWVFAGLPFVGTYIVAASAPNASPTYAEGIRAGQDKDYELVMSAGDGKRLTLAEIKAGAVAAPGGSSTGGGTAAAATTAAKPSGGAESKEAAAKREEIMRKNAEIEAKNKKIGETNEVLKRTFKAGNDAFAAKRYDEAIAAYDEGIAADPEQAVLYLNKSIALRNRAVEKYNSSIKTNDTAGRDAAKADFKAAVEASEKGLAAYRATASSRPAGPAVGAPASNKNDELNYLGTRFENYRLALHTNSGADPAAAAKAMQEYAAAETDPVKKAKAEAGVGDALFQSGNVEQAVTTYRQVLATNPDNIDALYGLGLALSSDPAKMGEARDMLQKFVSKAPAGDSRKAEAVEAVKALDDTLKANNSKPAKRRG